MFLSHVHLNVCGVFLLGLTGIQVSQLLSLSASQEGKTVELQLKVRPPFVAQANYSGFFVRFSSSSFSILLAFVSGSRSKEDLSECNTP